MTRAQIPIIGIITDQRTARADAVCAKKGEEAKQEGRLPYSDARLAEAEAEGKFMDAERMAES